MLHICTVNYRKMHRYNYYYEEDCTLNLTVEAVDEDEAKQKVENYFKDKTDTESTTYHVFDIDFWDHIP